MQRTVFPMHRTRLPNNELYEVNIYNSVQGLLYEQALEASRKGGVPFEDMRAQADLLFVQSLRRFDETVGVKFSTFLFTCVRNGLIDYGKMLRKHYKGAAQTFFVPDENGDLVKIEGPDMRMDGFTDGDGVWHSYVDSYVDEKALGSYNVLEAFEDMSADARAIAELVTDGFCDSFDKLRELAIKRLGFAEDQFEEAVEDLRDLVADWR